MIESNKRISRRQFLNMAGAGVLTFGLTSPFLQGCTAKHVEIIMQHLGELAQLINAYRKQNGLLEIPISGKLTAVALKHIMDLNTYHPENICGDKGNEHSWSNNGNWTGKVGVGAWKGCCYPDDHSNQPCMWDKPKEIANYPGNGYEIVHSEPGIVTAQSALNGWKSSPDHNDVILNKGKWGNFPWKAIGAVYGGNFSCAWFGKIPD